uniref:Uncharacterized protein n=1 Tax=Wuchereria bancrofti TaxID=6293 RepID=A0AAF5PS91_WUCBA
MLLIRPNLNVDDKDDDNDMVVTVGAIMIWVM